MDFPKPKNPDTYTDTFDARGDLYNAASSINPHSRCVERELLIDFLDVQPDHVVCDAPAGGGYLADGLRPKIRTSQNIVCVEPSHVFSEPLSHDYTVIVSPIAEIPVADGHFDRIGSLAGLHHLGDKQAFFMEASRTLKPGGLIAVGDVLEDTPVARFLNGPVDHYTTSGHQGQFIRPNEYFHWFEKANLQPVLDKHYEFHWGFRSDEEMVAYCQSLFGMVKANRQQVREALFGHFDIERSDQGILLPWSLVYGVANKPVSHSIEQHAV